MELARVSNLPSAWGNVLAGAAVVAAWGVLVQVADGAGMSLEGFIKAAWEGGLGWAMLAGTLMYLAGMLLNDAKDASWDRIHRPERPIPSGRVAHRAVWAAGFVCWAGGILAGMMVEGGWAFTLALALAVVGYTWTHKDWAGGVVLMAACRTLLVLLGSATLAGSVAVPWWVPSLAGLALGCHIMGLTVMARTEATSGRVPVVAWVLLLAPLAWALGLFALFFKPATLVAAVTLAAWIAWVRFLRRREGAAGTGAAVGRLLAGMTLVDAIAVSLLSLPLTLVFLGAAPLLRLWQRWVAAT